jgi:MoaA/NifB/PqqE/SkfB family radical SAM enzyme
MSYDALLARSWEENRLVSVLLELTYRCNLDCFFCYNDLSLRGTPLTFAQYDGLLQDLAGMNVLTVILSGGEPLAHPDFFRIGARARELGFVTRVKTNGHAVHGELARRLRDEVDPFVVEVSLHGATAESHDRQTRVPGSFDRLLANLGEMLALGLRVKVNSTLTRWNEDEIEAMYAITDALDLPLRFDLQVTPKDDGDRSPLAIAPTAEGIRRLMAVDDRRAAVVEERAGDGERRAGECEPESTRAPLAATRSPQPEPLAIPRSPAKHCGAGSAGIAVDPFGNVYPCVQWRRPVASLHQRSMREIWGDSFSEVRAMTAAATGVVAAHPHGKLLNFCPGLAEALTGSALRVPQEMERVAEIVAAEVSAG